MTERAFWKCANCGAHGTCSDYHCRLCHWTMPKGESHECAALTEAITIVNRQAAVIGPRSPWPGQTYAAHEVGKE